MQMKSIRDLKDSLRQKYKTVRMNMTTDEKTDYDKKILNRLTSLHQYKNASVILTYVSKNLEVDTLCLIHKALSDNKRVAVPKCIGEHTMNFYFIKSVGDLEVSTFGVLEPIIEKCRQIKNYRNCFCIVPGMSFDTYGYRLGYGKGYYDRFLSEFTGATAGLCYSKCVKWSLPKGHYDKPVDILVTEKYFRKCSSRHENEE